jgi:hypothetical protein
MKDLLGNIGEFVYFGLEVQLKKHIQQTMGASGLSKIELLFNIDGVPISKSSSRQFWPILCACVNRNALAKPFVVGIFCGNSKPESIDAFLSDFIKDLKQVRDSGMPLGSTVVQVAIKGFICDAPARAFIKCIKGHGGYYGCERCTQKGEYIENKIIFPLVDSQKRTDSSFRLQEHAEHHKALSPLMQLDIGLVSQFPLEYMHLVCLGAMKKLLLHWMRGSKQVRISHQMVASISDEMERVAPFVCCEFVRKPRTLREIDCWKAVEYRLFLCYIGPVILRGQIDDKYYHHFMLLHHAIILLVNPDTSSSLCDYAEHLLKQFVHDMPSLYGRSSLVYTMHSLLHICDDVRQFGSLDSYSAFAFESKLGQMKRMLRTGKQPLAQLCRRLAELEGHSENCSSKSVELSVEVADLTKAGPTSGLMGTTLKKLNLFGVSFCTSSKADCFAFLKDGRVVRILNFLQTHEMKLVCCSFLKSECFYTYPQNSESVGVLKLKNMSAEHILCSVHDIAKKCMVLPRKDYFVALPVLHTSF